MGTWTGKKGKRKFEKLRNTNKTTNSNLKLFSS